LQTWFKYTILRSEKIVNTVKTKIHIINL